MSRIQFSLSKVINMHCKNILECVTRRWLATFKCGYTVCSAVILYHIAMRRRDIKRSKAVCFVSWRRKRRIDEDTAGNMDPLHLERPPTIKNHHHHHHLCATSWQLKLEFAFIIVIWDML